MILKKWDDLPSEMQNDEVRPYYDSLSKKRAELVFKRIFDIVVSCLMLLSLSPIFLILAIAIKVDSKGPVFYRQARATQYNKQFRIFKFRTMVQNADKSSQVSVNNDSRITRVGRMIRRCRLDETAQLIDVLRGTMTFVGTRPEALRYVREYTPEMMATLLLPAGITSLASIYYKDEDKLLNGIEDIDNVYIEKVLNEKMHYNLKSINDYSFCSDIKLMFMTVLAVLGRDYMDEQGEHQCSKQIQLK